MILNINKTDFKNINILLSIIYIKFWFQNYNPSEGI